MAKAEAGTEAKNTEQFHDRLPACLYSAGFLVQARPSCPGLAELTEGWAIPHRLEVKFYMSSPPNNPGY